jgi:short-subunit dehydrogenase
MLEETGGRIAVVSSLAGRIGMPKMAFYGMAKASLNGFFRAFRTESTLLNRNVSVTIHTLGSVDTDAARDSTSKQMGLDVDALKGAQLCVLIITSLKLFFYFNSVVNQISGALPTKRHGQLLKALENVHMKYITHSLMFRFASTWIGLHRGPWSHSW